MFPNAVRPAHRQGLVLALALALAAFGAQAENVLNFDQALRLAQGRSRQIPAQEAATTAAREMAVAAAQLPDPTLKAGIDNLPINGPDQFSLSRDFMTQRSIGLAQEFTRADKRKARAARFDREAEAAQAGSALALANLQRDTAIAWLDRHYQERLREVLSSQRDEARLQIDAAEAAYRGGKGAQADVFAARTAVAQIDDRIAQAERQVATAKIQLARWVGDTATQPLGAPPATDAVRLSSADLETRLAHHPQIAVMVKQEEMAEADVQFARANRKADWSAELMFSQRGPAYSNMVSVNLSIPLQWDRKNRQDRELAAKLATAEQMRAQREEASREHVAEALAMLEEWQSNRERLKHYDASLIPLAADRTRATLAAYRGGTAILSAVLDARRTEIDVRMERVRLEMETARLWAQLTYLIPADHDVATLNP
ncbi:MAG: TolC family protein [Gammaproteobacteria bacterium]|nr:TolC family protein [Gammaproteobacteria bacterium]MBU1602017.1 TolC family protein [Gammaproteobacteria bacterium]MBU2433994.1 TolC family protein [Gammaproteobacteria bacterium]MBU2447818.1 TolC family protein [Gammaproteobacteria bacterium]